MDLSYKTRILNYRTIFYATIKIYRRALKYIIKIVEENWSDIKSLQGKERNNFVEDLIHKTKDNTPVYDFDKEFPNFPCYFRREVINTAIGIYSSYITNYENWLNSDRKTKPPKLRYNHNQMPVFYKGNMYDEIDSYTVKLKLFYQNCWQYIIVKLRKSDIDYIEKFYKDWTKSNPILEVSGKVFSLRFCFSKKISIPKIPLKEQIAIGVDLNVKNKSAVCSAVKYDGTVISRKFINCGREKGSLNTAIQIKNASKKRNQKRKLYQDEPNFYCYDSFKARYRMIDYANTNYAICISREIISFAIENNATVIVFEHLDKNCKKKFMKERLHFWNCKMVFKITSSLAHKNHIKCQTVLAFNTSKLAFDGSGQINRHKENKSMATFTSGKIYNADLSASYNIASRYFIREIKKAKSEKTWLAAVAKVPSAAKRTSCTLSTLINIVKAIENPKGFAIA